MLNASVDIVNVTQDVIRVQLDMMYVPTGMMTVFLDMVFGYMYHVQVDCIIPWETYTMSCGILTCYMIRVPCL
jgi:hypothetical protein